MSKDIDRDAELRARGHLYEIGKLNDEFVGSRRGYHMTEEGYETTLRNVAECAGLNELDEIAEYIKDQIRETKSRPANRRVRRYARRVVTEAGQPANEYLNAA
jgi:hypothetical protein